MIKLRIYKSYFLSFKLLLQGGLSLAMAFALVSSSSAWTCVYVSSYHKGYAWSDGVERGLRAGLEGTCELTQFSMDTKRHKDEEYVSKKAREIAIEIKKLKPDVLITSDDNAARYLVVPYFKGVDLPVVFSGINWTVDEYGFPASNVTGMVEVAPVKPMLEWAYRLTESGSRGLYIGADTLTERKNSKRLTKVAAEMGIILESSLVDSQQHWQSAFGEAQEVDFIVLGSYSGIKDWDEKSVTQYVMQHADKLVLTNHRWMMPFAMLGFVKIPEEQGEWAAKTAIAIHNGVPVQRIPIIANRKWEVYVNVSLLKLSGNTISKPLQARAKKYTQGQ